MSSDIYSGGQNTRMLGGEPVSTDKFSPAGATARSSALTAYSIVRVVASAAVNVAFGDSSVTADATGFLLPANTVEYFSLGANTHIAAYGTADVYVTILAGPKEAPITALGYGA